VLCAGAQRLTRRAPQSEKARMHNKSKKSEVATRIKKVRAASTLSCG